MSSNEGEAQGWVGSSWLTGTQHSNTGSTRHAVAVTLPPPCPPKGLQLARALYDTRFLPYNTAAETSKNANKSNTAKLYLKVR